MSNKMLNMKNHIIKVCLFTLGMTALVVNADAQRVGRKRANAAANNATDQTQQQTNNVKAPSGYNPYGNIPIVKDSVGTGYNDSVVKKSLRPDDAFDKSFVGDRTPLPYEHLRWDDALFTEKVWRELDLHEKLNMPFRFDAEDDNGSQMFVNILLKAIKTGSVTAFEDDRFSTPLSATDLAAKTTGGPADTTPVYDPNDPSKIIKYVVTQQSFDPKSVMKLRLKEEWIFDKEASRMFVRILGIAPVQSQMMPDGKTERTSVLFWVYYPDLRPLLAKYEVYNPKNMGYGRMTWEEMFESRMFSSYITKSTLDNPSNKVIRQMVKDPILALLEGDNIKDRIFNYEQDLWSY
jgi:gliding motility associated protien GldN